MEVQRARPQQAVMLAGVCRCPALVGALLLPTRRAITKKSVLGIPGIAMVGEGWPAVFDNSVQNRLGF